MRLPRNLQELLDARDVFGNRLCAQHCAFHEMAARYVGIDIREQQRTRSHRSPRRTTLHPLDQTSERAYEVISITRHVGAAAVP
jgi:hypothetical protein